MAQTVPTDLADILRVTGAAGRCDCGRSTQVRRSTQCDNHVAEHFRSSAGIDGLIHVPVSRIACFGETA